MRLHITPASNSRNDGHAFERELADIAGQYASQKILRLKKVDPPTKTFGKGRIIHLENPFLDFVGTWTERGGRAVFIEAKSTTGKTALPFGDGGLTENQINALRQWTAAGAVAFVLWQTMPSGRVWLATSQLIQLQIAAGRRSIPVAECFPVPQGMGFIVHDFRAVMETIWQP